MNEELILQAGKTYVFKDDECREKYLNNHEQNPYIFQKYYEDGFTIEKIDPDGEGCIGGMIAIDTGEHRFFKLKEPATQEDNPVETPVINEEEELPIVRAQSLATTLHNLSDSYTLFYTYHPDDKFFLVDYKEHSYKVASVEDVLKLEQMIITAEELTYVE